MKKYYTIENQETKAIDNKFYSIYIEGMQYGNLIRRTNNFSQALDIYRDLKSKFNIFKCNVVLDKHLIFEDGTTTIVNIYKKTIGQDCDLEYKFKQIIDIIDDIDKLKRLYNQISTDADRYISAFTHVVEEENTENISDETMREIWRGVEEKGSLRRISKSQTDYIQNMTQNIGSIRSNANKCIETCKRLTYLNNTDKAKQNSKAKSEEYRKILGLTS